MRRHANRIEVLRAAREPDLFSSGRFLGGAQQPAQQPFRRSAKTLPEKIVPGLSLDDAYGVIVMLRRAGFRVFRAGAAVTVDGRRYGPKQLLRLFADHSVQCRLAVLGDGVRADARRLLDQARLCPAGRARRASAQH